MTKKVIFALGLVWLFTGSAVSHHTIPDDQKCEWYVPFSSLDGNSDGSVSKVEAAANPWVGTHYGIIDNDSQGGITEDEYDAYFQECKAGV